MVSFQQLANVERFSERKYFFRFQKIGWRFIGFWPGSDIVSRIQLTMAILNGLEVLIYVLFQLNFCYENRNNLVIILDALTPTITQFTSAMKIFFILWNRSEILAILTYLRESFEADAAKKRNVQIHGSVSMVACFFTFIMMFFANVTNTFFASLPAYQNIASLIKGGPRSFRLPFKAVFPFNIFWSPLFELIFVASMWSGHITVASIYGSDGMFLGICAHLSGEFNIIGSRINTLIEQEIKSHESTEKFTPEQNDLLYEKLKEIVKEHEKVIEMCKRTTQSLWANGLLHYVTSAILTCICCLMVLLADGADKLIFVNYIIASTAQILVYSIGGTMLEDASIGLKFAAYDFDWYKCNEKVRRMILMIMVRAQDKIAVDVPFFEASMETFGSIIRAAGSYITMLKTFL